MQTKGETLTKLNHNQYANRYPSQTAHAQQK
jgi:hypothetical protein